MNFPISLSNERERVVGMTVIVKNARTKEKRPAFSRWTHFAWVLVPTVIAQAFLQFREIRALGAFPEWLGYTGHAKVMAKFDYSVWPRVFVFLMFVASLASALALLHAIGQVEASESKAGEP